MGFAVMNTLTGTLESPVDGSQRLLTLQLHTFEVPLNGVNAYTPTVHSTDDDNIKFYDHFGVLINHNKWSGCFLYHGIDNINDNGQIPFELCSFHNLCITNTSPETPS